MLKLIFVEIHVVVVVVVMGGCVSAHWPTGAYRRAAYDTTWAFPGYPEARSLAILLPEATGPSADESPPAKHQTFSSTSAQPQLNTTLSAQLQLNTKLSAQLQLIAKLSAHRKTFSSSQNIQLNAKLSAQRKTFSSTAAQHQLSIPSPDTALHT